VTPLGADLARTHARAFRTTRPWAAEEFAGLLAAKGVFLTGDTRGFALGRVTLDEAEVLTIATDPAHQRQGLARAALQALEAQATAAGARQMFLEVAEDNTPARALYLSMGYAQTGRRPGYYATGPGPAVAALILSKPLDIG